MTFTIFSVFNILIATAMIILILMQRGSGSDAGAGFGGGSSGTVFGARGSASFMTRTTGVLAGLFFLLSLGMGMYVGQQEAASPTSSLGVMESMVPEPAASGSAGVAPAAAIPAPISVSEEPAADAPATDQLVPQPSAPVPPPSAADASTTAESAPPATTTTEAPATPEANN